jgi:hypothetical protein
VSTLVHANIIAKMNHGGGGGGGGDSPFRSEPLSVELVRPLPEYPGSSLKVVKPVFSLSKPCTPCPEL